MIPNVRPPLQPSPSYTPTAAIGGSAPSSSEINNPLGAYTPPAVFFSRNSRTEPSRVASWGMRDSNNPSMRASEEHGMKCEVLVFDGPGICPVSKDDLVNSLNTVLAFNYWVGTIDHEELRTKAWYTSCVLLVFPHCTDTQSYDALDADLPTIHRIRRFVKDGGSFLGICGGAYFASKTPEWHWGRGGSANFAFLALFLERPHF